MATEHSIPVGDDETIAAVHHPASTDQWIVFCHGFLSDKTGTYEQRCNRATAEGFHGVRFDFRGCGESSGAFIEQTLTTKIQDLTAVIEYFELDAFVVFGSSFGGKVAFHTAATNDAVRAIAVRAPVTYRSHPDDRLAVIQRDGYYEYETGHRIDDRFFADIAQYEFEAVETAVSCPVAIFHGDADTAVPVANSIKATDRLATDVLFQKYRAEGHRFSRSAEQQMRDQVFDWLRIVS